MCAPKVRTARAAKWILTNKLKFKNNGKADEYPLKEEQRKFRIILSMQYGNDYLEPPIEAELPLYMDIKSFKYWKKC